MTTRAGGSSNPLGSPRGDAGLIHTVLIRAGRSEARISELCDELRALLEDHEDVEVWKVRRDLAMRRGHPNAYDVAADVVFADEDRFRSYLVSPAHKRFLNYLNAYDCDVASLQTKRESENDQ